MKVLVTGATGFVGSHLAEALIRDGYEVRALVRPTSSLARLKNLNIEIVNGDIRDFDAVTKAVKDCRQVYHLAAERAASRLSKNQYHSANVTGTENVARAALNAVVDRLIYAGGTGIYGIIGNPPVNEETAPNPNRLTTCPNGRVNKSSCLFIEKKACPSSWLGWQI